MLLLSITVDPLTDGPAQLSAYAQRYGIAAGRDKGGLFLTGERARLPELARVRVDASIAKRTRVYLGRACGARALDADLGAERDAGLPRMVREVVA